MSYAARNVGWGLALGFGSLAVLFFVSCDDGSKPTSPPLGRHDPLVLSLRRGAWTLASHPVQSIAPIGDRARAKLLWYNPVGGVPVKEVYSHGTGPGAGMLSTFRMIYRPRQKLVNFNLDRAATDTIKTNSWAGIMTYFDGIDTIDVQHFEMRVKGAHGRMHLDFGRINEDVNNDRRANTEDGCTSSALRNLHLEWEEDRGLDGTPDSLEGGYDRFSNHDPSGDNWFFQGKGKCPLPNGICDSADFADPRGPLYYEYINGTEGNINDLASVTVPDQEQLSNTEFNTRDSFCSFVVNLADTFPRAFYVPSTYYHGWKTYRIPIRDPMALDALVGSESMFPDWTYVMHVRVWFESEPSQMTPDTVEVAEWKFTRD